MTICLFYPVNRDRQLLFPQATPGSCLVQQPGSAGHPPPPQPLGSSLRRQPTAKNKAIWLIEVLSLPQIDESGEAPFPVLDRNAGSFVAIAKFPGKPIGAGSTQLQTGVGGEKN